MFDKMQQVQGTATVNNGAASTAVIAAQGAGKVMRLMKGVISVTVAATGNTGLVNLKDGSTVILSYSADAVGDHPFDFGERGFGLTANTALNVDVTGAGTTQATARATVVALVS